MAIPKDRPVCGNDLLDLRERLGLTTMSMSFLLGVSITEWTKLVKKRANEPINDHPLEIIVRYLDEHPESSFIPQFPNPKEFYESQFEKNPDIGGEVTKKHFAVSAGRQSSGGYRWTTLDGNSSAKLDRVLYFMRHAYETAGRGPQRQLRARHEWEDMVRAIGQAYGVADVFVSGQWTKKKPPKDPKAAKAKRPAKPRKAGK